LCSTHGATCCYYHPPAPDQDPPILCGGECSNVGQGNTCHGDATTGTCCPPNTEFMGGLCCNLGATLCGGSCCDVQDGQTVCDEGVCCPPNTELMGGLCCALGATLCGGDCCNVQDGHTVCDEAFGVCCGHDSVPCGGQCCSAAGTIYTRGSTCLGDPLLPSAKCCPIGSALCGGDCCLNVEGGLNVCIGNASVGTCCCGLVNTQDTPLTPCGGTCCHTGQYPSAYGDALPEVCIEDAGAEFCCNRAFAPGNDPVNCGGICCDRDQCAGNATVGTWCSYAGRSVYGDQCCDPMRGYTCLQAGSSKALCCLGNQSTACGSHCCDAAFGFHCVVDGSIELCCYGDDATTCGGLCCTGTCMGDAQDGRCCYGTSTEFCLSKLFLPDSHVTLG
jgi:hypothetical protein